MVYFDQLNVRGTWSIIHVVLLPWDTRSCNTRQTTNHLIAGLLSESPNCACNEIMCQRIPPLIISDAVLDNSFNFLVKQELGWNPSPPLRQLLNFIKSLVAKLLYNSLCPSDSQPVRNAMGYTR